MKIIGEPIFAKDGNGRLVSRVGTLFFKTPGLVTKRGVHATQRMAWIEEVNAQRAKAGLPPMTEAEEDEELAESVDLIFNDEFVLIRPDPDHMDLAMRADEVLQEFVSKRKIRFLNTHSAKVRNALRARGENWRMARQPISQEDMVKLIESSRVAVDNEPIYYYNGATGTRYLTVKACEGLTEVSIEVCRATVKEAQAMFVRRNRLGHVELDLFPVTTPIEIKQQYKDLKVDEMSDEEFLAAVHKIDTEWRMSLPPGLRDESTDNYEWRNAMCETITAEANDTTADEREILQGVSPEFYRQIEWLPGCRIDNGELIFDPLWEEYSRTRDPELAEICDWRVRNILFNISRLYSDVEYVNVGRIVRSLAREPVANKRRGKVYIMQLKSKLVPDIIVLMGRFQKWDVAEHLDEGKDLLTAILESNEYTDYIMDRRLMCKQLGMNLPPHISVGSVSERYRGENQYKGITVRAHYYSRAYVSGVASDKVPPARFRNPAFAQAFAYLMGKAAALDLVVGRRATETGEHLFDKQYEILQTGADGLPTAIQVTDHTGTFVNYIHTLTESVPPYANVVRRRKEFLPDVEAFANAYVEGFKRQLAATQANYRAHRKAFDELFSHRPYDVAGSGAYRWAKILERLDKCDPEKVAGVLRAAIDA